MTVKQKAAVRPMPWSSAVPHAEPDPVTDPLWNAHLCSGEITGGSRRRRFYASSATRGYGARVVPTGTVQHVTAGAGELISVGQVHVLLATAEDWVRDYANADKNRTGSAPYAYPAYDRYAEDTNDPLLLTDGDLLAPVLLNVRLSIRSFYALQRSRPELHKALANPDLARPLAALRGGW